jgi:GTP-binding protein
MKMLPIVAIVGRPNVGKSTLFNRVIGKRLALEFPEAGTTRDRLYAGASWAGRDFLLVDTAGITYSKAGGKIAVGIKNQIKAAVSEADLFLFLVDGREGLTSEDKNAAQILRKSGKTIVLAANKVESEKFEQALVDFLPLGLGLPLAVSAASGRNIGDLLDEIVKKIPKVKSKHKEILGIKVAIVGRPNVGKSSIFNALIGEERALVSDIPGTTRDIIDTKISVGRKTYVFLDTAGLRKKARINPGLESLASLKAIRAIEQADICLLVLDYTEKVASQELQIAGFTKELGKGLIILVNKWDVETEKLKIKNAKLLEKKMDEKILELQNEFRFVPYAPVVFVSAKTKLNLTQIFSLIEEVNKSAERIISAGELASLAKMLNTSGKLIGQIKLISQIGVKPPSFVIYSPSPKAFGLSQLRYIDKIMHEKFAFVGVPINFRVEKK